ncbi:MAG: tetratricopeptide repeat protein [Methanobacteriota archaeon]|nr:MAG: tetratricopeptide repeat protein [Euryarchaeota archaeon]
MMSARIECALVQRGLQVTVGRPPHTWQPLDVHTLRHNVDMLRATESEHASQTLAKLQQLSQALADFNSSARSNNADFGSQMEHMVLDVQELRGAVELNEHRLGETETKIEQSITQRLDALTKQMTASQSEVSAATERLPTGRKEALAFAQKLYRQGRANDARAAWRAILKTYPKTPGVSDEAFLRLGDSYMDDKRYDAAMREYIHIVEKFAQSANIDDAYYKIGICSLELGRLDDAQTFLGEVVQNHRKSRWARQARAKLDDLARRAEQKKARAAAPASK